MGRVEELLGPNLNVADAEIVSIDFHRAGPSIKLVLLAPFIRNYTAEYVFTFIFDDVDDIRLENFNHLNVLMGLVLKPQDERVAALFASKYGAELSFTYRTASVIDIEESSRKLDPPFAT